MEKKPKQQRINKDEINWNLYRIFIDVYEEGSLTVPAKRIGITRSAIAYHMRELSNRLGVKLFDANPYGLDPTNEAHNLYVKAKQASKILAEGELATQTFDQDSVAVIKMAMPSPVAAAISRKFFKDFSQKYKNIKFEFFQKNSLELLHHKKIDFMIEDEQIFKNYKFSFMEVFESELILIASKNFLKQNGLSEIMTKEQFLQQPIIGHKQFIDKFSDATGITIEPTILVQMTSMVTDFVSSDMGIGLHFGGLFEKINKDDNLVRIEIKDVPATRSQKFKTVCAYNEDALSKASKTFMEQLVKSMSRNV